MRKALLLVIISMVSAFAPLASAQGDVPVEIGNGCYIMKNGATQDSCKIVCETGDQAILSFGAGNVGNVKQSLKTFRSENDLDIPDSSINIAVRYYSKNRNFLFNGEGRGDEEIVISVPLKREI